MSRASGPAAAGVTHEFVALESPTARSEQADTITQWIAERWR